MNQGGHPISITMTNQAKINAEGTGASLFQPDSLLAAKYLELRRRKSRLEPEKRLMFAILEDAVACFQEHLFARDEKGEGLFRDAEEWILEEKNHRIFGFENVCEVLGLDPDYVRQGLNRWKEMKLATHRKTNVYQLMPGSKKKKNCGNRTGKTAPELFKAGG